MENEINELELALRAIESWYSTKTLHEGHSLVKLHRAASKLITELRKADLGETVLKADPDGQRIVAHCQVEWPDEVSLWEGVRGRIYFVRKSND